MSRPPAAPKRPAATRAEREAAALRRNLLRRKQQGREREAVKPEAETEKR